MIETSKNRRTSTRHVERGGTAICRAGSKAMRYRIQDASSTGVALKDGPRLELGTQVELELWWPMIGGAKAHGVICRQGQDKLAVSYTQIKGMASLMGTIATIENMRVEEPIPLVCGRSKELELAHDCLERAGFELERARSPLEAMHLLQDPWNPITSIIIPPRLPWLDFSAVVSSDYPSLRRVMLTSEDSGADTRLASEHQLIDQALRGPWKPDELYSALGLSLSDERCLSCNSRLATRVNPFCAVCRHRSTDLDIRDDLGGGD